VQSITITPGAGQTPFVQSFTYDALNRLLSGTETQNGAQTWKQTYGYDRYGNRWFDAANTTATVLGPLTSASDFNASNNRIVKPGYSYDQAGNLTAEPGKSYAYDAENRLTSAIASGVTTTYVYDGEGRRVRKNAGGVITRMIYNHLGQLIAEYNDSGSLIKEYIYKGGELLASYDASRGAEYATGDHLGSPRIWTNSSGQVITGGRHDYLPFGEELFAGVANRTTVLNYPSTSQADGKRHQFTSKERDIETNLDYFLARYYSSAQGRFTSVDPVAGNTLDPQTLNKYSYVANNPLARIDPDGLYPRDQHQYITFLMAAILGIPEAEAAQIGLGAGHADSWRHATTGLGIPIPGLPFSIPPIGWPVNFPKHFGKIHPQSYYNQLKDQPFDLGFALHNVEDIAPGGPHHILKGGIFGDGSTLFARILDSFAHVGLDIGKLFGLSKSPDRDPKRQGGWEAAWKILSGVYGKSGHYPKNLIEAITGYLNRTGRTLTGLQYGSYSLGEMPDPKRYRLVDSFVVDGVTVNVYEEIKRKKK